MKLLIPESIRMPARERRGWLLLVAVLMHPVAAAAGGEPPSRIVLRAPEAALHAGQPSALTVELNGESGKPAVAKEDVQVELQGLGGLSQAARLTIPAGASRVKLPIRPPKPGLWQIEARSRGLRSGSGTVACVTEKMALRTRTRSNTPGNPGATILPPKQPAKKGSNTFSYVRPEMRPAMPPPPPPPSTVTKESTVILESITPGSGRVELIAQPAKLRRLQGGWETSRIDAFWFDGNAPEQSPRDLSLSLIIDGGTGSTTADPSLLSIPSGAIKSQGPARVSAREAGTAAVRALYSGGQSKPVQLEFLSALPSRLGFAGAPKSFRGLASGGTELWVRLLADDGEPAVTEKPVAVDVAVAGPTGTRSYSANIAAGAMQAKVALEMNRPGSYTIQASAPGLADSEPLPVRFAVDWLLLSMALLGGVLGSLTRVLYRWKRLWLKGIARVLVLGVAAALLVLLLSLFGLLSLLAGALPAGVADELQKVSATSLFGVLLLGYLAGLLFDKVLGRFLGSGESGKPSPQPKEATV